ncbi:MAG TPA: serine hydrolase domain-containing protein [Flavobacteriales bacterium]|nr:serine hydrolase domain-containing protein [Flavobacteriales bacterium]HRJ35264.1 serine hydrolase domain-containing protein [Flavobacteriales bacterium]
MKPITVISLLLIGQITFGQNNVHKIDSIMTSCFSQGNFNGNVLIFEKDQVIYKKSFGFSNESTKEKLNENSIFELASVSKQFTATAIVLLKEKGKLSYEDEISKYIPELSDYSKITIRNLLTHTSGLPDYMEIMDSTFDKNKIATNKDIISTFSKLKPKTLFEPNTKWEYSNTGYALLASIIEKVSGMTYGDYLNKAIFKPLKMKNTSVYRRRYEPRIIPNYAYGYVYSDSLKKYVLPDELDELKMVIWLDGIVGDGTVNSTVVDLLKWDRALRSNKFISKESKDEIFTSAEINDKTKTNYGFGWVIEDNGVYGNIVSHTGGWPGYMTLIERHLQNDKTIIVLMNYVHNTTNLPVAELRRALYNIEPHKFIALTNEETELYAGNYMNSSGRVIKLICENGVLFRPTDNGEKFELKAISSTKFVIMNYYPEIFYEFILKGNKVEKLLMTQPELKFSRELIRQ